MLYSNPELAKQMENDFGTSSFILLTGIIYTNIWVLKNCVFNIKTHFSEWMWNDIVFINTHFPTVHLLCIQKVNQIDKNILPLKNCILKIKTHFSECLNKCEIEIVFINKHFCPVWKVGESLPYTRDWAELSSVTSWQHGTDRNIVFLKKLDFTYIKHSFSNASSSTCFLPSIRSDQIRLCKCRIYIFLQFVSDI